MNRNKNGSKLKKSLMALGLGVMLTAAAACTAWADPMGLSILEGNTVKSRDGGFAVSFPAGYQVTRDGSASSLSYRLAEGMKEDGSKVDFVAASVDEAAKRYIVNIGIIVDTGSAGDASFNPEKIKQEMAAGGVDASYVETGSRTLGNSSYNYIRFDYGKQMADYARDYMTSSGADSGQMEAAKEQLAVIENMMVRDLYYYQNGDQAYALCRCYSADMAQEAANELELFQPYSDQSGWVFSQDQGWSYLNSDGSRAANVWVQDEAGLTYHLDGNGAIQYNAWIEEGGRWKYADEFGHMVTSVTKTINGVQYTFGADGFLTEGSERPAHDYELGTIEGKTYINRWADIRMTFPETAEMRLGDGSDITYPLAGGEHVDVNDPELSYRITVDFTDNQISLDRYLEQLAAYGNTEGYKVDFVGSEMIGGYEYKVCRSSYDFGDGTSHHSDTYVRRIDGKMVELYFDYYDEMRAQADSVFASIARAD